MVEQKIIDEIKSYNSGYVFVLRDVFEKFGVQEKDMMKVWSNISGQIANLAKTAEEGVVGLPYNVPMRKKREDEINKDLVDKYNNEFNKLDYDFYFEYSLNFGKVKISPKHFALITKNPTKLFIINEENKTKLLFDKFMNFVKGAGRHRGLSNGVKTGIIIKMKWANKIKYIFKKKPAGEETRVFLENIFKESGFLVKE